MVLVKEKQNITELIEKVEELDRHFEEIEWQEIMRRNRRAWYSMELDIVLTRDPQEIAKEININYLAITGTQFSSEITAEQNRFASSRFAKPPSLRRYISLPFL